MNIANFIERVLGWVVSILVILAMVLLLVFPFGCLQCTATLLFDRPAHTVDGVDIYARPGAEGAAKRIDQHMLDQAKARVVALLGEDSDFSSDIIVGDRDQLDGDIDFAGWVAPSFLGRPVMMLPIESLTEDVLAHELVHVALIHRWGYWRTLRDLPEWVNEGLAMQVDHRASFAFRNLCYLLDGDPMPVIEHLDSQSSFYAASSRRLTARYSYVKQVVERTDIPGFLVAYDRGGRFEDVGTGFFKDLSANEVC